MRIAVDVMGGDHGPAEAVAGACKVLEENPERQLDAFLNKNIFWFTRERHDPDTQGGAPLPGLRRPVIIAHGNARAAAIAKALAQAATAVSQKLTQRIAAATEALNS